MLRAVMRTAGTDPGAVHYHFGDRTALAAAVLDRVLVPLNQRRLELLDAAGAHESAGAAELVEALIGPDIEQAALLDERGAGRGRLIAHIYLHPEEYVERQVRTRFAPVAAAFMPHLAGAMPSVAPDLLAWRVRWVLFGTLGAYLAQPTPFADLTPTEVTSRLTTTLTAALTA